jgi:hypothetical protein
MNLTALADHTIEAVKPRPQLHDFDVTLDDGRLGWALVLHYTKRYDGEEYVCTVQSATLWSGRRQALLPLNLIPGDSLNEWEQEITARENGDIDEPCYDDEIAEDRRALARTANAERFAP